MKTDGVMEAARRLHFDLTMCFSCSFSMIIKQTLCPLLKGLLFLTCPHTGLSTKPYTQFAKCPYF